MLNVQFQDFLPRKLLILTVAFLQMKSSKIRKVSNGDMVYLAPETFKCMTEEEDHVDEKVDVLCAWVFYSIST